MLLIFSSALIRSPLDWQCHAAIFQDIVHTVKSSEYLLHPFFVATLLDSGRACNAGSPLGIFLTLRKVNPAKGRCLGGREAVRLMLGDASLNADGLPAVERLYNLYHPFDPVGFRSVDIARKPL